MKDLPQTLAGARIVVAGASSGIGLAISKEVAARGALVCAIGRDLDRLRSTVEMIPGTGHCSISWDLAEWGSLSNLAARVKIEFGSVTGLVYSAGVMPLAPFRATTDEMMSYASSLNYLGPMAMTRAFLAKELRESPESVIFLGSISAVKGSAGLALYGSTKAALLGLSRSLAQEYAVEKIRFNVLLPGVVETNMAGEIRRQIGEEGWRKLEEQHPLGFGLPGDIANVAALLLSQEARWITGSEFTIDGGYSS